MAKTYTVGNQDYEFPDNYTDQQVQDILTKQGIIKGETVPKKVMDAVKNLFGGKNISGGPMVPDYVDPQTGEKIPARPSPSMALAASGAPSIAGEVMMGAGYYPAFGKAAAKGAAALGLAAHGHPWMGLSLAGRGLGDLGEAAKIYWNAFKAAKGAGAAADEFETWLKNETREPIWKGQPETGSPLPKQATPADLQAPAPSLPSGRAVPSGPPPGPPTAPLPRTPAWAGMPEPANLPIQNPPTASAPPALPSGRIPKSFADQSTAPIPEPPPKPVAVNTPKAKGKSGISESDLQAAIQQGARNRSPNPAATPTPAPKPAEDIPSYMQGEAPQMSAEEMANRGNLADKIAQNLHSKNIHSKDMEAIADDSPVWGNPEIAGQSSQPGYTPSRMTKDMVLDRMRNLEKQKFNDVFQSSLNPNL